MRSHCLYLWAGKIFPFFLMIGDNDTAIIPVEAKKIKDENEISLSQVVVMEGAGHNLTIEKYRLLYANSIMAFLFIAKK